ncbi:MAG: Na/Pi cotransporter family protein [bacterium]|nr:Na/Pi cotransporter family protein [bacterium]
MVSLIQILGGLALFLYGLNISREGLSLFGGEKLRKAIYSLTDKPVRGLLVGVVITLFLQSSSATSVMLVGFASSGMISLFQSIGVILGADVASTLTVQLISFRVMDYALLPVAVGFFLGFFVRHRNIRYLGRIIMGFGLLFFGIKLMSDGALPLAHSRIFMDLLQSLGENPLGGFFLAALLTALVQASAATIGLVISFSLSGAITLPAALPMILGANIGTSVTAFLAAAGSNSEGKQVAWAHFSIKLLGVLLVWPLLPELERLTVATAETLPRQIANAHTIFNLGIALLFLPFRGLIASGVKRAFPGKDQISDRFAARYLDPKASATPDLAFVNASREILRIADIVEEMLKDSLPLFFRGDLEEIERIRERDKEVNSLDHQIRLYLARVSEKAMTGKQAEKEMRLHNFASSLETMGDVVVKNILALAEKKFQKGLTFSSEGWEEIRLYHLRVSENLKAAVTAFAGGDESLIKEVLAKVRELDAEERRLKLNHIRRLHQGLKESIDTSAIHLDLLNNLQRINSEIEAGLTPYSQEPETFDMMD